MRFSTWLFTIGSRLASNHRRDTRRLRPGLATEPLVHLEPSAPAEAREEHRRVWSMVDSLLNEQQRAAIWLRYAEGLEPADIARVLGKTGIGVRVLLFRARERLTEALADERPHPHHAEGPGPALQCAHPFGGAP
jgi:RNA polymerase sigma factor (sigma-70 family)